MKKFEFNILSNRCVSLYITIWDSTRRFEGLIGHIMLVNSMNNIMLLTISFTISFQPIK